MNFSYNSKAAPKFIVDVNAIKSKVDVIVTQTEEDNFKLEAITLTLTVKQAQIFIADIQLQLHNTLAWRSKPLYQWAQRKIGVKV